MKWIVRILLFAALLIGGWYVYTTFFQKGSQLALALVPRDAVFIFEAQKPIQSWKEFSECELWSHLRTHPTFAEIDQQAQTVDSLVKANELLLDIAGDRTLTFSLHITKPKDFDFLYSLDLKDKQAELLTTGLKPLLSTIDSRLSTKEFNGYELIQLTEKAGRSVLTIAVVENILLASYTEKLIQTAIEQQKSDPWAQDSAFIKLHALVDPSRMFNVYMQLDRLEAFSRIYSDSQIDLLRMLSGTAQLAGLEVESRKEWTSMEGYFMLTDSGTTFLHAMKDIGKGKLLVPQIASDRTAVYLGLLYDNYLSLYDEYENQLRQNPKEYAEYRGQMDQIEGYLKINVREHLLSWFGNEVALLTYPAREAGRNHDRLLVVHTRDARLAKSGLNHIMKQIRRRTPLKFKAVDYKDYTINLLEVKGLFKLVLGKLFQKFERPYFTYVGDFVVFSNQLESLQDFLDDYDAGRVLEKNPEFEKLAERFDRSSHLFAYAASEPIFPMLNDFVSAETVKDLMNNELYAKSFRQIGVQMTSESDYYRLRIHINYEPQVADSSEDDNEERETQYLNQELAQRFNEDGPYTETYSNDALRIKTYYRDGKLDGDYRSYWRNGNLMEQGDYRDGIKVGTWYYYNRRGKLERKEELEKIGVDSLVFEG